MKRCPRCDKTYPDSETFCDADGSALVQAGPAFAESAGRESGEGEQVECPVCGGKAQPGELICNFCGARLGTEADPAQQYTPPPSRIASPRAGTSVRSGPSPSMRITGKMPEGDSDDKGRGMLGVIGYVIAAIVALGGGAWLALHLQQERGGSGRDRVACRRRVSGASTCADWAAGSVGECDADTGDGRICGGARAQPGCGAENVRRSQGRLAEQLHECAGR